MNNFFRNDTTYLLKGKFELKKQACVIYTGTNWHVIVQKYLQITTKTTRHFDQIVHIVIQRFYNNQINDVKLETLLTEANQ